MCLNTIETINLNGVNYTIEYVAKDILAPAFGMAYGNHAQVREDLSPRVKRFVKSHELYHLQDKKGGGRLREELRASFYPGLNDPIGLLATIKASLTNERLKMYFDRFRHGY